MEDTAIPQYLQVTLASSELGQKVTARTFRVIQTEGPCQVCRDVAHYNLDAAIAMGYRINSVRIARFRRATQVSKKFAVIGYVSGYKTSFSPLWRTIK